MCEQIIDQKYYVLCNIMYYYVSAMHLLQSIYFFFFLIFDDTFLKKFSG